MASSRPLLACRLKDALAFVCKLCHDGHGGGSSEVIWKHQHVRVQNWAQCPRWRQPITGRSLVAQSAVYCADWPDSSDAHYRGARWAPSAHNEQPWRFYTSNVDTFNEYLNLLTEGNRVWAKNAAVIGFIIGKKQFEKSNKDNTSYLLDCGAAWMSMTLHA